MISVSLPKNQDNNIKKFKNWLKKIKLDEKPHQIKGMKFCLRKEVVDSKKKYPLGGIIADEMGLGKTILMLGTIVCNHKKNKNRSRDRCIG